MGRFVNVVAGAMIAACTIGPVTAEELRIGVRTQTSSMDPHFSTLISNIEWVSHVFEQLVSFGPNMELNPALATSWKVIDDTTWEFELREGVEFHDGSPFTADDVIFTWERLPELSFAPDPFVQYIQNKAIEKIDDHTIRIKTEQPSPTLPNDMAQIFIVPKGNAGMTTEDYNSGKAAIGTGPYKLAEYVQGDRLVMTANPAWWNGQPKWERVEVKPIESGPSRVAALLSGQVDLISNVPTEDIETLKANPDVVISSGPSHRPLFLHLDSNRDLSPHVMDNSGNVMWPNPLRDWRVRMAFAKSIDRVAIVDRIMEGNAIPATQFLPEGFYGHNPDLEIEPYDPEGARALLAEAGYPDGFSIRMHGTNDRYVNDGRVMETLAQMLTQIGIKTELELLPISVYYGRQTNSKEYSVFLGSHNASTGEPSAQLNHVIHTTWPGTPYCCIPRGYSNPRVDDVIEEGNRTLDDKAREALYQEAIKIAVDDVGLIFLHLQMNNWASRKGIVYNNRTDEMTVAEAVELTE